MTRAACPSQQQLLQFVDADMPPETLGRIREHIAGCQHCLAEERALLALIEDVRAPVPGELDLGAHTRAVMARLEPEREHIKAVPRWGLLAGALPLAAGILLFVYLGLSRAPSAGTLQARGGPAAAATLSRDVGVRLYAGTSPPRLLESGAHVSAETPFVAGYRNLAVGPAFLLLFAVDAGDEVHWIAPAYTDAAQDPEAVQLPRSQAERLLETTAVFEDLPPGPLRLVSIVTRAPRHVSHIERLPPAELASQRLARRFGAASVRELTVHVEGVERHSP